ncbi:MAG: hypothetical protein JWP87_4819 [Labilithrix sp.]|nr:hypothetical protein [Labilithrix sp.]
MPRAYAELLSDDPAWPALAKEAAAAPNGAVVLPPPAEPQRRACLEALQMTTRSTLGALAHETGGVLVDHGYLRMFGAGSPRLPRPLVAWNADVAVSLESYIIVADDVVGGVFAIDTGGLGGKPGRIHYFAPDSLEWEDTELGHSDFVSWAFEGDLGAFYEHMRWPGWEKDVAVVTGDRSLSIVPPMWTEGATIPIAMRDRREVPAKELWLLQQQFAKALGRA